MRRNYVLILIVVILLVVVGIGAYFFRDRLGMQKQAVPKITASGDAVLMKVGEELIFEKDLEEELRYVASDSAEMMRPILTEKLASDSAMLQGGAAEKLVTLDESVFNSPNKDYAKRYKLVEEVRNKVSGKASGYKGRGVTVYFYNTLPAKVGLERGKQLANQKVTLLYEQVKNKQLTMEQAAEMVEKDPSYEELDEAHEYNGDLQFEVNGDESIVPDKDVDKQIKSLNVGELSPIYLVRDIQPGERSEVESYYLFVTLDEKNTDSSVKDFQSWLAAQVAKYQRSN